MCVWSGALELEASFTRRVRECFYFAVIEVAAAVENHSADVRALGALCEELADLLCTLDVGCGFLETLVHGGRGNEGFADRVVDDLGVDVLIRVMDGEARTLRSAGDFATDAFVDALADRLAIDGAHVAENS